MVIVKKLGVLSVAKIEALIMAFIGLIEGILVAISGPAMQGAAAASEIPLEFQLGTWAILALPIIYLIIGFVFGALGAAIYNLFAKWVGGMTMELEGELPVKKTSKK
jgi:hypothetical protein